MAPTAPLTVADLLHRLRSGNSAAPRLTWYGPGGERVELSGRVLDNWAAKTSNLLVEELDLEPGARFRLDLPAHWKTAVLALAAWQAGAVLVDGDAQLLFSAEADGAPPAGATRVVVALGALDLTYSGTLSPGDVDYAAQVRQFADSFDPFDPPAADDDAAHLGGDALTQSELLGRWAVPAEAGARILVDASRTVPEVLAALLGAWAADGSVVLLHQDVADTPALRKAERITAAD